MVSGVGASRVRDLFDQAKASAPCIIFIDEIDAVGRMRGFSDADEEREQTLNQILVAMDGFDSSTNVVVIAATNRADLLDPALVRPGRFDRRIVLSPPDVIGRERILQVHARGHPLNPSVDLAELARVTDGLSGADLANVMNEAAILAVRRNLRTIDNPELEDALDRVMAGMQQARCAAGEHDRALMAIHEAGRALVGHYLPLQTQQFRFTLAPHRWREQALGERELHATRREVTACLTVTLAGRAAEDLVFGEGSTLSEHDIRAATSLAHHLVCACGMSGELGNLALEQNTDYSEITAEAIDREVRRFMEDAAAESRAIIVRHRGELDGIAQALLKREIITTAEVTELCAPIDCATSD
jgi:cell division protease FtsH